MLAMLDDPDLVRDNTAFFVDHQIAFGKAQIAAGAHALWLGDCVASSEFLSPAYFSEFAAGPAGEVASALTDAGAIVIYHTAETSAAHLKLQVELPASAINVGEGDSIAALRPQLDPDRCLMGNFDPILLRDGEPEAVAAAADAMVRKNSVFGGYIFNTGEGVMADSPPANVKAMMAAARDAGRTRSHQ
jgi:uroporphyrinogen-III decarboxylase